MNKTFLVTVNIAIVFVLASATILFSRVMLSDAMKVQDLTIQSMGFSALLSLDYLLLSVTRWSVQT